MSTNTKHWRGRLKPDNMNEKWLEDWRTNAAAAIKDDEQIVLFQIPKWSMGSELLYDIERLIQERVGK